MRAKNEIVIEVDNVTKQLTLAALQIKLLAGKPFIG